MEKYDIDISEIDFIGNQQRSRKIIEEKRQQRQENIITILAIIVFIICIIGIAFVEIYL